MTSISKVFITDCEGPISKNDNAFELTRHFVPNGARFFTLISLYDDVLSDIIKIPGHRPGDTLRLILPFLKAFGVTNKKMQVYSSKNILLIPGADETIDYVKSKMPTFIVSTSYEPYILALSDILGFSTDNVYCTKVDIDKYPLDDKERIRIKKMEEEIVRLPMIEIPERANSLEVLSKKTKETIQKLDIIFCEKIPQMTIGRIIKDVNPVGGYEKAKAVKDIIEKTSSSPSNVMYVGDSITDVEPIRMIRKAGGLTVSFNGNSYAVREADIAVLSHHTIVTSILAEAFMYLGKDLVICLVEKWPTKSLEREFNLKMLKNYLKKPPKYDRPMVAKITPTNMRRLINLSRSFRKKVRGTSIGKLG